MKLKELLKKITIQGDVRISIWDVMGEEELEVREFHMGDHLCAADVKDLQNMEILYMFAGPDGMLHIELDVNSGKKVQ